MHQSAVLFASIAGALLVAASTACAEHYYEVEAARANARAGGPVSERDKELLEKYGALSGTRGYSKSGLRRLDADEGERVYKKRYRRHD